MFEGLGHHEAVEVEGGYLVCFKYGSSVYDIDGERITPGNHQIVVASLDSVYRVIPKARVLLGFKNPDTGRIISREELYKERDKYYDEELEEFAFPDLETQYTILKRIEHIQSWESVYEEAKQELVKVDFNLVGKLEDTGSAFIITAPSVGRASFAGGVYKTDLRKIALDEVEKAKELHKGADFAMSGSLQYLKINNTYVFGGSDMPAYIKDPAVRIFKSLEEAKSQEKEVREYVRRRINAIVYSRKLDTNEIKDLIKTVQGIYDRASEVDVKMRSSMEHSRTLTQLVALRELLIDMANE